MVVYGLDGALGAVEDAELGSGLVDGCSRAVAYPGTVRCIFVPGTPVFVPAAFCKCAGFLIILFGIRCSALTYFPGPGYNIRPG